MARDTVIPNAVIISRNDPTGQVGPSTMDAAKTDIQIMSAGKDSLIPLIYGGPIPTGGLFYFARIYNSKLVMCIILCEGTVYGIDDIAMADVPLTGGAWSSDTRTFSNGVTVKRYFGTQVQVYDATLYAATGNAFQEDLKGTAYLVVQVPIGVTQGFPLFTAKVYGLLVYDPRQNRIPFSNLFSSWSNIQAGFTNQTELGPLGEVNYAWKLEDTDLTQHRYTTTAYTVPVNTATYVWSVKVKKTSGGTSKTPRVDVVISGGTSVSSLVYVNTDLGTTAGGTNVTVKDCVTFWLVSGEVANNNTAGNVTLGMTLFPAIDAYQSTIASASPVLSTIGFNVFCDAHVRLSTSYAGYVATPTAAAVEPVTAWSDNPALITADHQASTVYGGRKTMNWNTVGDTATYCDSLCGAEKRATLSIAIAEKKTVDEWKDILRAYIPGWVLDDGAEVQLVPDAPRASDHTFTSVSILGTPTPKLTKRGVRDVPTVVEIGYTRTDTVPWSTGYVEAATAVVLRKKSRIEFPGIIRGTQAYRFAVERLNHYNLEDLSIDISLFEDGLKVREGDVITVTDDILPVATPTMKFRVLQAVDQGHGRWAVTGREYNAAAYSNAVIVPVAPPTVAGVDPNNVTPPTGLTLAEVVYLERVGATGAPIAGGMVYQSRLQIAWTATTYPYAVSYRVQLLVAGVVIDDVMVAGTTYTSAAVQQGSEYVVKVQARNSLGVMSTEVAYPPYTAIGKGFKPQPVLTITQAFEAGGDVILEWVPAVDLDIVRYMWRYTPGVTTGGTWESSTLIDQVDSLRARFSGLITGLSRFYVKPIDSIGQESVDAAYVDINVTSDANAFLQYHSFTNPFMLSAELVVNGDFASGTGWTLGTGWAVGTGTLNASAAGTGVTATRASVLTVGLYYQITFTITAYTNGGVKVLCGTTESAAYTAVGSYALTMLCAGDGTLGFKTSANPTNLSIDNASYKETSNLVAYSGAWVSRAAGDKWDTAMPNPINDVAGGGTTRAVYDFHSSVVSKFIGDTWMLPADITGDWTLAPDTVVPAPGTPLPTYSMDTSMNGSTWTNRPGLAWKGMTRYIRPVIQTTGTMIIMHAPKIAIAALSRSESGAVQCMDTTTPMSDGVSGKLVKLTGLYSGAQDLQATAINAAAARIITVDRVLLYPESGLMHSWTYTGAGESYWYRTIDDTFSRLIATGDYLEYEVYVDPSNPVPTTHANGGIQLANAANSTSTSYPTDMLDTEGYSMYAPAASFDVLTRGVWKYRKASLAAFVGTLTVAKLITSNEGNTTSTGPAKVLYKNIRITDGSAVRGVLDGAHDRLVLWWDVATSGEPVKNVNTFATAGVSNLQCGPSNSFLLYAFDAAGVQTAQTAPEATQYSFRGF
jgi:hypothetical protein